MGWAMGAPRLSPVFFSIKKNGELDLFCCFGITKSTKKVLNLKLFFVLLEIVGKCSSPLSGYFYEL